MAAHARVKNTEDEKCHNFMNWLKTAFTTMHGRSAVTFFSRAGSSSLLNICTTPSFVKQKITLMQVCTSFFFFFFFFFLIREYGISGFLYDVIIVLMYVK